MVGAYTFGLVLLAKPMTCANPTLPWNTAAIPFCLTASCPNYGRWISFKLKTNANCKTWCLYHMWKESANPWEGLTKLCYCSCGKGPLSRSHFGFFLLKRTTLKRNISIVWLFTNYVSSVASNKTLSGKYSLGIKTTAPWFDCLKERDRGHLATLKFVKFHPTH